MSAPRLLCDEMLGRLARDLRLLGFDVAYVHPPDDTALLALARREGRLLLTRDRELARRAGAQGHYVEAEALDAQLDEALRVVGVRPDPGAFLSRCAHCGGRLEEAASRDVAAALPEGVAARHPVVQRCAGCGHLYWAGTHVARIRARLGRHLDGPRGE